MGLTVSLFIPDAIIIASDSLAEIRQNDDGFYQGSIEKVFRINDRYVLALEGSGFFQGLPYSYYANRIIHEKEVLETDNTVELSQLLSLRLSSEMPNTSLVGYVAGYDYVEGQYKPVLTLLDKGRVSIINQDPEGDPVYNFHTIGRNHWVNKIILPASLKLGEEELSIPSFDIDFSKYSVNAAKEFAVEMISFSEKMDRFSQLKPMIGGEVQIAVVKPYSD